MSRFLLLRSILVSVIVSFLPILCVTQVEAANDRLNIAVARANSDVDRYDQMRDVADLKQAVYDLGTGSDPESLTPANFVSQGRLMVSAYARILQRVEAAYDPTYDPDKILPCPIPPQISTNGPNMHGCADPSVVLDAGARATYSAQLSSYLKWQAQVVFYMRVNQVDTLAMTFMKLSLEQFTRVSPSSVPSDFAELTAIIQKSGISETRQAAIRPLFLPNTHK